MTDSNDDPYLAELLDLVKDDDVKPNGSSSSATGSSSQSATKAKKPASTVVSSPSQYQDSDTHRETLKLLLQFSPAGANLPTTEDVQKAFCTLYPPFQAPQPLVNLDGNDEDVSEVNPSVALAGGAGKGRAPPVHLDTVQEELEEHLGAMDLFTLRGVIRAQVDAWHAGKRTVLATMAVNEQEQKDWTEKEEKEEEAAKQKQNHHQQQQQQRKTEREAAEVEDTEDENNEQLNGLSQSQLSQSQASQDDGDTVDQKRKRGTGAVGGRTTLSLRLPKSVSDSSTSRSFLVELDERDKAQDLTGDSGAVGRVHVEKKKGIILDLKGHQYLAHLRRCPTLLLVSVGDEEAKVEDVVETLCVLTHQHDQLEAMGGKVVSRAAGEIKGEEEGEGGGYISEHYRLSDESECEGKKKRGGGGGGGGKTVVNKRNSGGVGVKKGKGKGGKGGGGGGGGGGSRKSMGSSSGAGKGKKLLASSKKQGPRKVSLRALKQQKTAKQQKGSGYDDEVSEDEEESFEEQDDDDSDFSI